MEFVHNQIHKWLFLSIFGTNDSLQLVWTIQFVHTHTQFHISWECHAMHGRWNEKASIERVQTLARERVRTLVWPLLKWIERAWFTTIFFSFSFAFYRLEKFAHVFSMTVVFCFSLGSYYYRCFCCCCFWIQDGFRNPSQFQTLTVSIDMSMCNVHCACIYFAHSVQQFRLYSEDWIRTRMGFCWFHGIRTKCILLMYVYIFCDAKLFHIYIFTNPNDTHSTFYSCSRAIAMTFLLLALALALSPSAVIRIVLVRFFLVGFQLLSYTDHIPIFRVSCGSQKEKRIERKNERTNERTNEWKMERIKAMYANKNVKRELIATSGAATACSCTETFPPLKNIFNQMIHSLFMCWSLSHCTNTWTEQWETNNNNSKIVNVGNIYLSTTQIFPQFVQISPPQIYCHWYTWYGFEVAWKMQFASPIPIPFYYYIFFLSLTEKQCIFHHIFFGLSKSWLFFRISIQMENLH